MNSTYQNRTVSPYQARPPTRETAYRMKLFYEVMKMANAEHLIENAVSCLESGKSYEDFAHGINREMAGNLDWYLEEIWQMANYIVNKLCCSCEKRINWISVEDELPNPCTEGLLFADTDGSAYIGEFGDNKFYSDGFGYTPEEVTHWIPLVCMPFPERKEKHHD